MKITAITSIVALTSGAWAFAPAQVPQEDLGIRFISSNRILAEATEAKAEVAKIQTLQQQKAADLREKQQALETTREQLAAATEASARTKLQQQESQQRTMQAGLQAKLKVILDDMLKGQNVKLVLNGETAVVWSAPGNDLTSAIIERWNASAQNSAK